MWDDDIAIVAMRAILTYGEKAVNVLDIRAARLRQRLEYASAEMWQAVADMADDLLTNPRTLH
jgi:hypothetical protein